MSTVFGTKKNQGLVFLECRICWFVGKFIFKNTFPVSKTPGVGLCESLNLGHRVVSSGTGTTFLLGSGTGDWGVGPRRMLQPSGRGCGEAELPISSFGRDKGPVPSLGKSRGGGRSIHSLSSEGPAGVPDGGPWGRGWKQRPRPNWHRATHIPAKPAAFVCSSLS